MDMRNIFKSDKSFIVTVVILVLTMPFWFMGLSEIIYYVREIIHYSNKANFVTENVIVTDISYSSKDSILFDFDELNTEYAEVYNYYEVTGKNVAILLEKDILEKVSIGDQILCTYSHAYFGDGYIRPVVAISIEGEELLSFEEGYKNFIEQY